MDSDASASAAATRGASSAGASGGRASAALDTAEGAPAVPAAPDCAGRGERSVEDIEAAIVAAAELSLAARLEARGPAPAARERSRSPSTGNQRPPPSPPDAATLWPVLPGPDEAGSAGTAAPEAAPRVTSVTGELPGLLRPGGSRPPPAAAVPPPPPRAAAVPPPPLEPVGRQPHFSLPPPVRPVYRPRSGLVFAGRACSAAAGQASEGAWGLLGLRPRPWPSAASLVSAARREQLGRQLAAATQTQNSYQGKGKGPAGAAPAYADPPPVYVVDETPVRGPSRYRGSEEEERYGLSEDEDGEGDNDYKTDEDEDEDELYL